MVVTKKSTWEKGDLGSYGVQKRTTAPEEDDGDDDQKEDL